MPRSRARTKTASVAKAASSTARKVHPLSEWLRSFLDERGWSNIDLAQALKITEPHVSRLLWLAESDRPTLELLGRIFTSVIPQGCDAIVHAGAQRSTVRFKSWEDFHARRSDVVFFELAKAMAGQPTRANPSSWIVSAEDELGWQQTRVPQQRWLVTSILAENCRDEVLAQTCKLLKEDAFRRLVLFMSKNAMEEFEEFHRAATRIGGTDEEVFRQKVMCVAMGQETFPPFMRMRLDDAHKQTPLSGGVVVFGLPRDPVIVRIPASSFDEVCRWFVPIVRAFEHSGVDGESGQRASAHRLYYPQRET